ncbi:MAG TPA: protoglobin domain-containing protein [Bryobacteraceae bacterium]
MKAIARQIPGYIYGTAEAAQSRVSATELEQLKQSVGFTTEDEHYLRMAGEVFDGQTKELVDTWRSLIAKIPHLAKHSKDPEGNLIPHYSEASGLRFQQWILDTCFRPYDSDWLNYQQEIALRHTALKKNVTDGVESTDHIPFRHIVASATVITETVKPFLASKGHSAEDVEKMHSAWRKSLQLQIALWAQPYCSNALAPDQW